VISRDVVVDEAASWSWETDAVLHIPFVLEDRVVTLEPNTAGDVISGDIVADDTRRSHRTRFPSSRLSDYEVYNDSEIADNGEMAHFAFMAGAEPLDWKQAINIKEWRSGMLEEIEAIERNKTWELSNLPLNKHPIDVKWVFKVKFKPDGSIAKHKARLVAKELLQRHGIDYTDVYAPVARMETVCLVIAMASLNNNYHISCVIVITVILTVYIIFVLLLQLMRKKSILFSLHIVCVRDL